MLKKLLVVATLLVVNNAQAALNAGDIAFTALNADEDGWALTTFVDIAANTKIFFSDNEYVAGAFNTGESFSSWTAGAAQVAAGTVIRFNNVDSATLLGASIGTFQRESVALSTNYGVSTTADTVYAYLGTSANAPTTFLTAISNATDGSLVGTGLTEGVNAIRLNSVATSASPDFGQYTGVRTGLTNFADYQPLVANVNNWVVDTSNGSYATTVPNTSAFTIAAIPEPETYAMLLAGLGLMGFAARRKQ